MPGRPIQELVLGLRARAVLEARRTLEVARATLRGLQQERMRAQAALDRAEDRLRARTALGADWACRRAGELAREERGRDAARADAQQAWRSLLSVAHAVACAKDSREGARRALQESARARDAAERACAQERARRLRTRAHRESAEVEDLQASPASAI